MIEMKTGSAEAVPASHVTPMHMCLPVLVKNSGSSRRAHQQLLSFACGVLIS